MLNNGVLSGGSSVSSGSSGMGTPDGTNGGMYPAVGNGPSPSEYPAPSGNPSSMSNSFHHHQYPHMNHPHPHHNSQHQHHNNHHPHGPVGNGMMGHHSGGLCSQMGLNQGACPPDTKINICAGCEGPIMDRHLVGAMERLWHISCLKCSCCGSTLPDIGNMFYFREGMTLCKNDYIKMFGVKGMCSGCGQHIPADEFVMRAGAGGLGSGPRMVFHVNCFTCSKCGKTLSTGDRYSVLNGALFCEQDALKLMKQNGIGSPSNANVAASNGPTPTPRKGKVGRPRRSRD